MSFLTQRSTGPIPRNLHFVFGLDPGYGGKPFSFVHWAAIRSAQIVNPGWKTFVWTANEPNGVYWDAIRPLVEVQHIKAPDEVHGNPIPHYAHKCDWVRLMALSFAGGVYMDCDTISVKPLESVISSPATMAEELADGVSVGLCNAFIAAHPMSEFIHEWTNKFRDFRSAGRDAYWNESAVKWPMEIRNSIGGVNVLPSSAFMAPDWTESGLKAMFEQKNRFPEAFGHHLWESFSWAPYLSKYTPENYAQFDCTYSTLLGDVLASEIDSTF